MHFGHHEGKLRHFLSWMWVVIVLIMCQINIKQYFMSYCLTKQNTRDLKFHQVISSRLKKVSSDDMFLILRFKEIEMSGFEIFPAILF